MMITLGFDLELEEKGRCLICLSYVKHINTRVKESRGENGVSENASSGLC